MSNWPPRVKPTTSASVWPRFLGVGPVTALTLAIEVDPAGAFKSGRHLAAWAGLTPREHSTGGKAADGRHRPGRQ